MPRDYNFVLSIGITNDLARRVSEHRAGEIAGFAADYHCRKLVYYENYNDVRDAIARETQLKKSGREKKTALINKMNLPCLEFRRDVLQG